MNSPDSVCHNRNLEDEEWSFKLDSEEDTRIVYHHVLSFDEWMVWHCKPQPPLLGMHSAWCMAGIFLLRTQLEPMSPVEASARKGFAGIAEHWLRLLAAERNIDWKKGGSTLLPRVEKLIRDVLPSASDGEVAEFLAHRSRKVDPSFSSDERCDLNGFLEPHEQDDVAKWREEVGSRAAAKEACKVLSASSGSKPASSSTGAVEISIKPKVARDSQKPSKGAASSSSRKGDRPKSDLFNRACAMLPVAPVGCRCFIQPYEDGHDEGRYQLYYTRPGEGQQSKSGSYKNASAQTVILKSLLQWAWHVHQTLRPDEPCMHDLDEL